MKRRTCGRCLTAAAMIAAHLIYVGAATPALAMQILDAADHAELKAGISATGVNRIALSHDRIRRVIRTPGGFEVEHDPETGDLWLRPAAPVTAPPGMPGEPESPDGAPGQAAAYAPVTLFIGTEKGFTYRLTLTPSARDSAQILIRNGAALARAEAGAPSHAARKSGTDPRVAALVGLIRAVARREPPAGYGIETPVGTGTGATVGGLPVIETWRGPRFAAHVVEIDGWPGDAGDLAGTMGSGAAAAWLAPSGSGPSGGRFAVIVMDAANRTHAVQRGLQ